jgi:hypothetical protein
MAIAIRRALKLIVRTCVEKIPLHRQLTDLGVSPASSASRLASWPIPPKTEAASSSRCSSRHKSGSGEAGIWPPARRPSPRCATPPAPPSPSARGKPPPALLAHPVRSSSPSWSRFPPQPLVLFSGSDFRPIICRQLTKVRGQYFPLEKLLCPLRIYHLTLLEGQDDNRKRTTFYTRVAR